MQKIIAIVGPTAVGKTTLSIELAKKFNGEIINGDAMQVYRGLDIGTAKVTAREKAGIVHHLIDICDKDENYNVSDFQKDARFWIADILSRGKLPIVVGGTGLYIQALLYDFQFGAKGSLDTSAIREQYQRFADEFGKQALWEKLAKVDPQAAAKIHFNNQRKVIRALEVIEATGKSILAPQEAPKAYYDYFLIGLTTDRSLLYQRIDQRVELMMKSGLEEEARLLQAIPDSQAARGIGYKEFFPYFAGLIDKVTVVSDIQRNSRHYAKRQLTWFRNRMKPHWYDLVQDPTQQIQLEQEIRQFQEDI